MSWFRAREGAGDFEVSGVQYSRDLANAGMSGIVTAGQFAGGEVFYWPLDTGGPADEVRRTMSPTDARKIQ